MIIKIGRLEFESSFKEEAWLLTDTKQADEKLIIEYSDIYNYFGNKIHLKSDILWLVIVLFSSIFLSLWILLIYLFPTLYFYHHLKKVRLDTKVGSIFINFNSIKDKELFLKDCKKYIKKQRFKNYTLPVDNSFYIKQFNKIKDFFKK